MKKLLLVLVILAIAIPFFACGPDTVIFIETPEGGESFTAGETMTIAFTVRSEEVTEVKIELYNADTLEQEINGGFTVDTFNEEISTTWTVADLTFSEDYNIVITDTANEANTATSKDFSIGIDPNKATIKFDAGVTFGSTANWSFDLYMSTDDNMILPDQDYGGDIGMVDWGFNVDEFNTYLVEGNLYSQISTGNNDLPDDETFTIDSGTYDWGIALTYDGAMYGGQFVTDFTELNNQYEFQAGETYLIAPQFPQGIECMHNPDVQITADNFAPDNATQGDTGVSVVITGSNFDDTASITVRLAANSMDDDLIEATSVTVDSATEITAVFDIPTTVPYTGEVQSTGSGNLTVAWYLQVIQDGDYALDEFTINQLTK